jgi:hypothetical protein
VYHPNRGSSAKEKQMSTGFWAAVEAARAEVAANGHTAQQVVDILNKYASPSSNDAFFHGEGADLFDALTFAGWKYQWMEASYYWVMKAPNGDLLTYIEGDVALGDQHIG